MIVWRDSRNKDRMVMGLDPYMRTEDPFLVTYDLKGRKTAVFGDYQ
ncbi:MAG: hypothetical protein HY549_13355 [Elusimicrobia bacterium]|nr:hypothetical protein [Elusimicrobiota bacterium]